MNQRFEDFQYIVNARWMFYPKTNAAALKGVEGGYLPEAALIYKGVNIRPVFEEPYDLMDLERLLARPNLDLQTVQLLMKVFDLMIKDPDKERALFAAETEAAVEQPG